MAPACLAATLVSSNRRRGQPRSPQPVALAWQHRGVEGGGPGAQPGGSWPIDRVDLQAVTSLPVREPLSKACRTMAVASTRAGTVGRPRADAVYRSAK